MSQRKCTKDPRKKKITRKPFRVPAHSTAIVRRRQSAVGEKGDDGRPTRSSEKLHRCCFREPQKWPASAGPCRYCHISQGTPRAPRNPAPEPPNDVVQEAPKSRMPLTTKPAPGHQNLRPSRAHSTADPWPWPPPITTSPTPRTSLVRCAYLSSITTALH